jgi:hypothetical protein
VQHATRGVLTVTDGQARRDVPLGPSDLRSGTFSYTPSHPGVLFRLDLYDGSARSSTGALRVLNLTAAAPPETASAGPESTRTGAAERGEAASIATQPTAIHEVHPNIPPGVRSRIENRIVVPVEVRVNAAGRVVRATAQGTGDSLYQYLATRAARSAHFWRFQPARNKSGGKVAATKTISFVFTKSP